LKNGTFSLMYGSKYTYQINIQFIDDPEYVAGEGNITLNLTGCVDGSNTGKSAFGLLQFNGVEVSSGVNVNVNGYESGEVKNVLKLQAAYTRKITSLTIDGVAVDMSGYTVDNPFEVQLTPKSSYTISASFASTGDHTIVWAYDTTTYGADAYVSGGTAEVISVNGTTPRGAQGHILAQNGDTVVVKLIPDYGKQISSVSLNGVTLSANAEKSTFTFTMCDNNLHFSGAFTSVSDTINNTSSLASGGSISNGGNATSSGTLKMDISDNGSYNKNSAAAVVSGATAVGAVDISLTQMVSKGGANGYWTTGITNFTNPISVGVNVSSEGLADNETYSIVRDHNGVLTELNASYNKSTGVLTFPTNQFSTYTIVKKPAESGSGSSSSSSPSSSSSSISSTEEEPSTPAVTQPTTLGTVVGGTTVKDWNDLDKILATKNVATAKTTTEKAAAKAPIILTLNKSNSTVPVSTIQALQNSDSSGLHLMMGNGASVTISNGPALKNQGAINLSNTVSQTSNSKTIAFANNTKLQTLGALHMSVPKTVKEAKLYYVVNGQKVYLGTFKPINGQVLFPIMQLGTYQLVY